MNPLPLKTALAVAATASPLGAATIITASQDHTIRRFDGTAGVENNLHVKQSNSNATDRFVMLRFDSAELGSSITSATFLFSANPDSSVQFQNTYTFEVWGVSDGDPQDEKFVEGAANYDPNVAGGLFNNSTNLLDGSQVTSLGTFVASAGTQVSLNTPALLTFLQADSNDTATLVVTRVTNIGGNSTFLDRTSPSPPRLSVESIPEPSTLALFALGVLGLARRRR